ncbi:MAG: hypothetical protein HYU54_10330 [Actinobacteria bacterium]|nr:hypothetical protein [Actinomycetota bacterium]
MFLAALAVVVVPAETAWAKMPYFSAELSSDRVRVGESIEVVMRTWEDVEHTVPSTWFAVRTLRDLFWAYPADERGRLVRQGQVPVPVRRVAPGEWRGTLTILEPGRWVLAPAFEGRLRIPKGYPQPIPVEVLGAPSAAGAGGEDATAGAEGKGAGPTPVIVGSAPVLAATLALAVVRRRTRVP